MREFYIRQFFWERIHFYNRFFLFLRKICVNTNLLSTYPYEYERLRKLITPNFISSVTAKSFVCFFSVMFLRKEQTSEHE